jgi:hypothetical protein
MNENTPIFSCCYCAEALTDKDGSSWVGISLYNKDNGDPGQAWFCHEGCFRERLHPEYKLDTVEWSW